MQGYIKSDSLVFVGKTGPFYGWQKNLEIYQQVYPDKAAMGTLIFDIKQIKMIDKNMPLFRCLEFANGKGEQKDFTLLVKNLKKVGKSLLTILVRFY
jgi:hypothetical protein